MGISGLLPLLKSIQNTKHLSELSGQTIAVDAYVWLHRGIFTCPTELATGKDTTKYVEFAMQRVRLLRHHRIQPYIVFDGGPLPAKQHTEVERKKRREDNLAQGNTFAAQGKHSQAREYYVKCVDVTPQMAFQFIKALRAENVPYVVAPYEADAQLAYLERTGIVDGILTEDSDLLVFGCRNVFFKLDAVSSTVTNIRREDFGSVSASDGGGISLLGWSDANFRAMAILSGCDYLPSISGIGLKTAYQLLKRHKTVSNAVRALRLEGKKSVPKGYLEKYVRAEKVFLHQRVYDPTGEALVHLMDLPEGEELSEDQEAYVGRYIEPSLAKRIAEGDACPVSLQPMVDINPRYIPRGSRATPLVSTDPNQPRTDKGKGKAPQKPAASSNEGILAFFGRSQSQPTAKSSSASIKAASPQSSNKRPVHMIVGRASGKRTLNTVMDQDLQTKRQKREETADKSRSSRFFAAPAGAGTGAAVTALESTDSPPHTPRLRRVQSEIVAGPSYVRKVKENVSPNHVDGDEIEEIEDDLPEDPVAQEDGYVSFDGLSPRLATPDLSSPRRKDDDADNDEGEIYGAEYFPSPVSKRTFSTPKTKHRMGTNKNIRSPTAEGIAPAATAGRAVDIDFFTGPDLKDVFHDVIDDTGDDPPAFLTPGVARDAPIVIEDDDADADDDSSDVEIVETRVAIAAGEKVSKAWWERWARQSASTPATVPRCAKPTTLRRHETTIITPGGRHAGGTGGTKSNGASVGRPDKTSLPRDATETPLARRSLVFVESKRPVQQESNADSLAGEADDSDVEEVTPVATQAKLAQFRSPFMRCR